MSYTVVIPARFASTRLPGKPLADINGKPMIQHVVERASRGGAARIVVATDHESVADAVRSFGGEVLMTSPHHPTGTDRLAEAAEQLGLGEDEVVVNVQGDEPLIPPEVIDQVARNLIARPEAAISTLCERIHDRDTLFNPNAVKVVTNCSGMALYFSRAPMPWARDYFARSDVDLPPGGEFYRHVGIYGYRAGFLRDFSRLAPTPLEQLESLEQLRALENGYGIHVDVASVTPPAGVDTPEDLARVSRLLRGEGA
ncbi:MAG: 3-deoxy-manno-octulosonate cytidylyltransferase [Gammaproteobacteria bacterium]|nr:MAG: 3-deoxy-manno-octulosonate cytidylyltransferase [Gammaproteobacteria bacterium]